MTHIETRFRKFVPVKSASDCWPWQGHIDARGYGRFSVDNRNRKATHLALAFSGRERPNGAVARHDCDNPSCVNPSHLRWGTQAENVEDMCGRSRHRTRQLVGTDSPLAKVDEDTVRLIREATGPQRATAERFGISQSLVSLIKLRKSWGHVL
jgi:hypothetical protein